MLTSKCGQSFLALYRRLKMGLMNGGRVPEFGLIGKQVRPWGVAAANAATTAGYFAEAALAFPHGGSRAQNRALRSFRR